MSEVEAEEAIEIAQPSPGAHDPGVRLTTLPSGLRVVSQHMAHAVTVSLGIWIGAGSRDERPDEHGLAHLLEHMAFKGTAKRSARTIAEAIESVGGDLNAATSVEYTCYTARVLGPDLALAVDILADILTNPALTKEELAREKGVILQEIGAVQDTPDDLVYDRFLEAAFPEQPLGRPILGTPDTVRGFTRDSIRAYLARHYFAGNMVLAATGAVDHDELVRLAQEHLAGLPDAPTAEAPREAGRYIGGEARVGGDEEQVHLVLGFPGEAFRNGAHYPLQIFASVLGGGLSSRLFQEVREKRGLAYAVSSDLNTLSDVGLLEIHAAVDPGRVEELLDVERTELAAMAAGGVTRQELSHVREHLRGLLLLGAESTENRMVRLAKNHLLFGRHVPLTETAAKIAGLSRDEIGQAAADILNPSRAVVGILGPQINPAWLEGAAS